LRFERAKFTNDGIAELQKALPTCWIVGHAKN
jgi:hypothetical protein